MDNKSPMLTPSLSSKGWLTEPLEKLDNILAHMFVAEAQQSYLLPRRVVDLHTLLANTTGNITTAMMEMEDQIKDYLESYFDSVNIRVTDKSELEGDPSNEVTLGLEVTVFQNGLPYGIHKLIHARDAKFIKMTNVHNFGHE